MSGKTVRVGNQLARSSRAALRSSRRYATANEAPVTSSHIAAGVAGGAVTLLAGYGYYHYSGAAKVVNTAKGLSASVKDAGQNLKDATPSAEAALSMLRSYAHTYAAAIPGASIVLDKSFDAAEKALKDHGEEAQKMLTDSYNELQSALKNTNSKDVQDKVLTIITTAAKKLQSLGAEFDDSVVQPLLQKSPALKEALSGSQDQLQELARQHGPKAKQIYDETMKEVQQMSNKGLNGETIATIVSLVRKQSEKIKELGTEASKDAYQKLSKEAGPLLDSLPDVRKLVDDKMPALESTLGKDGVKQVKQFYGELEDFLKSSKGKDAKTLQKDAKEFATKKLADLQDGASNASSNLAGVLDSFPGFAGAGGVGATLSELSSVAGKHGPEAKQLMESTMKDVKNLLEKRVEEAKKLSQKAATDAKSAAKENK